MNKNKSKTIYILGMHRSGTSMLANVISEMGAYIGPKEDMLPESGFNIFGYYELGSINKINDQILKSSRGSWRKPPKKINTENAQKFKDQIKEQLELLERENTDIVLKDPRISLLIDLWSSQSKNNKYIFIFRDPVSVANSLNRRDQNVSIEEGIELWREYNSRTLEFLKGKDFLILEYEYVLENSELIVKQLCEFLGYELESTRQNEISELIVPQINHFPSDAKNKLIKDNQNTMELYEELKGMFNIQQETLDIKVSKQKRTNKDLRLEKLDITLYKKEKALNLERSKNLNYEKRLKSLKKEVSKTKKELEEQTAFLSKSVLDLQEQNKAFDSDTWKLFVKVRNLVYPFIRLYKKIRDNKFLRKSITSIKVIQLIGIKRYMKFASSKVSNSEYHLDKEVVDYILWQRDVESKKLNKAVSQSTEKENIKFSIVMPVYNVDRKYLHEAIKSVKEQTYKNWEICIHDDASTKSETLEYLDLIEGEENIKISRGIENLNISGATNEALKLAKGEFILFMDNDDTISPFTLEILARKINQDEDVDVLYYDEDIMMEDGLRVKPLFKPDWSPDTLFSIMYLAHATYRKTLINKLGGMRLGFEGSQDYDLILRASELTDNIFHVPFILYHWRKISGSTADVYEAKSSPKEASRKALSEAIDRRKLDATIADGLTAPSFRIRYKIKGNPLVSIIIPTKNMKKYLKKCIDSIYEKSTYKNFEIIVVDNNSDDKETLRYLEEISDKCKVLKYQKEFNYAKINNFAVSQAKGDHVLLLNNDTEVIEKGWLEAMLEFSQLDDYGVVGSLLLFEDDTIQHAGCVLGIGGIAGHLYKYDQLDKLHMLDYPKLIHNVSAVTGACLMVKKSIYEEVGGLDEKLRVAFNDIDFCIKVGEMGKKNIYTPFSKLYHFESKSRGYEYLDPSQQLRFQKEVRYFKEKWSKDLLTNDPYYNPNLTLKNEFGELRSNTSKD